MIFIINDECNECFNLQLSLPFYKRITCLKNFKMEYIVKEYTEAIVFNFNHATKIKLDLIENIANCHDQIAVIIFTCDDKQYDLNNPNITVIPKKNIEMLKQSLYLICNKDVNWDKKIKEVMIFIQENIASISSVEKIAEHFCLNRRKLCNEFDYNTGSTLISFISKTRLQQAVITLKNMPILGKYYIVAKKCGFSDIGPLCTLIRDEYDMTIKQLHELLKNNNDNSLILLNKERNIETKK